MAIFQVQTVNGQKQLTPMTGGVPDGSVGSLIMKYKKIQPKNCLYCDGRDTTGTDEELSIYYPALYMYLGSNVLPDYRECTFVGAEQNTTDAIATHDVYAQGQFKDDQMQKHSHSFSYQVQSGTGGSQNPSAGSSTGYSVFSSSTGTNSGRTGTPDVTHGKQKAVYVYIVAVDSVVVSDDESFLRVVENYIDEKNSYSTTETLTGGTWIDGKPIYRKVITGLSITTSNSYVNLMSKGEINTIIHATGLTESDKKSFAIDTFINGANIQIRTTYSTQLINTVILEYTKSS